MKKESRIPLKDVSLAPSWRRSVPHLNALYGKFFLFLVLAVFLGFVPFPFGVSVQAQDDLHPLIDPTDVRGREPAYQLGKKDVNFYQPVRWILPEDAAVEIASTAGFVPNTEAAGLFGCQLEAVYRFKIKNIPYAPGRELYPTVEMIDRLHPPKGRETEFPLPLELTQEDLEAALNGNLVTRVVYIESPKNALPIDSTLPEGSLKIETPIGSDPVTLAKSRGRMMAIIRVGSRIPDASAGADFYFNYPPFTLPVPPAKTFSSTE